MIKQVHNSLTVHENLWILKFDNFSELQNVISDNPPPPSSHRPTSLSRIAALRARKNARHFELWPFSMLGWVLYNLVKLKRLSCVPLVCTHAAGGLGGAISTPVRPGQSPGEGSGVEAPEHFRILALKITYFRAK